MSRHNLFFKSIICSIICILLLGLISGYSFADDSVDITAPEVKSLELLKTSNIDTTEGLPCKIKVVEDGCGISHIHLCFKNRTNNQMGFATWSGFGDDYLFTDEHMLNFTFDKSLTTGTYDLDYIAIQDCNGNFKDYEADALKEMNISEFIIISKASNEDITPTKVNSIKAIDADNIDADSEISYSIELVENGSGTNYIFLSYTNDWGHEVSLYWDDSNLETPLYTGQHKITFDLNGEMACGVYRLTGFGVNDYAGNYCWLSQEDFGSIEVDATLNVTKSSKTDIIPPLINSVKIKENYIKTPGVIEYEVDLIEPDSGVANMHFTYLDESGSYRVFFWNSPNPSQTKSGKYIIKCPVSPFKPEGKYELVEVVIEDLFGNQNLYLKRDDSLPSNFIGDLTLKSIYDMAYFGSAINKKGSLSAINNMNAGETAVLDCRETTYVSEDFFKAIAGEDKTIVLDNGDVQWVFNGKKIILSQCKSINLETLIEIKSGASLGFPDDKNVIVITFADNGILPGEAEVRVNHDYITASYSPNAEDVILSYLNDSVPEIEDENVSIAGDEAAELVIDHNSTFVMSNHKARLVKPTLSFKSNTTNSIKLSWSSVPGAKGYEIYRSTAKDGTYKKVKSYKKTTTYTDKDLSSGKRYYYKIKVLSGDTRVKAVYSSSIAAVTKLKKTSVSVKSSTVDSIKLTWKAVSGAKGYEVYRSATKDGTYKKIKTYKNTTTYTDKNLKSGKRYYYKVKVLSGDSKIKAVYSSSIAAVTKLKKPSITVNSNGVHSVKISWNTVPRGAEYQIYRATAKDGTYKKIKSFKKTTSYIDKKLTSGKRYYYKIKVVSADSKVKAVYSKNASAKAILKTPTVTVKKYSSTKAKVKWSKISNAKNYTIYRASSKDGKYKKVGTTKNTYFVNKNLKKRQNLLL